MTRPTATASPLGIIADAAIVVDGGRDRVGRHRARRRPTPTIESSCADGSVIPGFVDSHAHLVFAGDRSAEFAARMSGPALRRRRHRHHGGRDARGDDATAGSRKSSGSPTSCSAAASRPSRPRAATGCDRRRRGPLAADRRRVHRRDDVSRRARGSRRVPRRPRRLRRAGGRHDAAGMRAACPLGRRVLRSRRIRRRRDPRHPGQPASPPGSIPRLHAGQLGPGDGIRLARRAGRGVGRSLHVRHRRRHRSARRRRRHHRRHAAARRGILHARTVSGRQAVHRRRRHRRTGDRLQSRAVRSPPACRSASPSRCGT